MTETRPAPSEAEQRRAAKTMARMRWANTTPEERSEFAAQVAAHRTPEQMGAARRDPTKPRCPCGQMTLKRAEARGHKCVAPEPPPRRRKK